MNFTQTLIPYLNCFIYLIGIITLIAIIFYFIFRKKKLKPLAVKAIAGQNLYSSSQKLFEELPNVSRKTLSQVATDVFLRLTNIGLLALIGLVIAMIPTILLFQQNKLIRNQTKYIAIQTNKVNIQTELLEAERRSSLIFLLSNIMDKLDEELKNDYGDDGIRNLSDELIGRISAISYSFRPYKYFENNKLKGPYSPERGQLLLALINTKLDSFCLDKIFETTTFNQADLQGVNLSKAYLKKINLVGANLSGANLIEVDFEDANLSYSNLNGAYIRNANLKEGNFRYTSLINVDFHQANLQNSYFEQSNLAEADMRETLLQGARFNDATFLKTDVRGVNFSRTFLERTKFEQAYLENANFNLARINNIIFIQIDCSKLEGLSSLDYEKFGSLYKCYNLDANTLDQLKAKKSCLFKKKGCFARLEDDSHF